MRKKILLTIPIAIIVLLILIWSRDGKPAPGNNTVASSPADANAKPNITVAEPVKDEAEPKEVPLPKQVLQEVPFATQAPNQEWDNPVYQSGCEEASMLMAVSWVRGEKTISTPSAVRAYADMTAYQKSHYDGFYLDTSAKDTARFMEDYYSDANIEYREKVTLEDIYQELAKGNVIMAPMNGQKLNNRYYVPPGPLEHMLLIIGYDLNTKELITNDPGTNTKGENLRYNVEVFYNAMQDYPSGYHEPILKTEKNIIIVKPKSI